MQLRHVHEFVMVAPLTTSAQFESGAIVSGTVVVVVVVVVVGVVVVVVVVVVVALALLSLWARNISFKIQKTTKVKNQNRIV